MVDFETSRSKSEVSKSNLGKITSFSKTMALQREPFLTMFYTNNLSPLLVTKKGFMLIIILSNYQQCPLPLSYCSAGRILHVFFVFVYWIGRQFICFANRNDYVHYVYVTPIEPRRVAQISTGNIVKLYSQEDYTLILGSALDFLNITVSRRLVAILYTKFTCIFSAWC